MKISHIHTILLITVTLFCACSKNDSTNSDDNSDDNQTLEVSTNKISNNGMQFSETITVSSNTAWTVNSDFSGRFPFFEARVIDGKIQVNFVDNYTGENNSGFIVVKSSRLSDTIYVTQSKNNSFHFTKIYGGSRPDFPSNVIMTTDNGFLTIGESQSQDGDIEAVGLPARDFSPRAWITKTDQNGNKVWSKVYTRSGYDRFAAGKATAEGGFILVGNSSQGNKLEGWVIKIDASGNKMWEKFFSDPQIQLSELSSIVETSGGNFLVTGELGFFRTGASNTYIAGNSAIIKINANGDVIWNKSLGKLNLIKIFPEIDGSDGFTIFGKKQGETLVMLKIDQNGNLKSEKDIPLGAGAYHEIHYTSVRIAQTPDRNYLFSLGGSDNILLKINASGNVMWSKKELSGVVSAGAALIGLTNGNFITARWNSVVEHNSNGDTVRQFKIPNNYNQYPFMDNFYFVPREIIFLGNEKLLLYGISVIQIRQDMNKDEDASVYLMKIDKP